MVNPHEQNLSEDEIARSVPVVNYGTTEDMESMEFLFSLPFRGRVRKE
jgi:hypothetical protein